MKILVTLALFTLPAGALAAPICGTLQVEGPKHFLSIPGESTAPPQKLEVFSMTEKTDAFLEGDVNNRAVCIDGKLIHGSVHALKFLPPRR